MIFINLKIGLFTLFLIFKNSVFESFLLKGQKALIHRLRGYADYDALLQIWLKAGYNFGQDYRMARITTEERENCENIS